MTPWLSLLLVMGCVLAGSFVAAAEASITSMTEARLRALADKLGDARSKHIQRYLADPYALLSRWLTFRIVMLVLASQLVSRTLALSSSSTRTAIVLFVFIGAWATMVELFSAIGRARGAKLVPLALEITRPVEWVMAPLAAPIAAIARLASKLASAETEESDRSVIEREVEYVVEAAENKGALDPRRGEMLQNVLEFKDVTVRDVMVPRTNISALPARTPCIEALVRVTEEAHSRVPVYDGTIDNIVGILHVKDLFRQVGAQLAKGTPPQEIKGTLLNVIRKPVLQVPPMQSAMQLLREMQARRTHMAVVIDEFGAVAGIVTLEDLLEELVGEIADEHDDVEDAEFVERATGKFVASAAMAISDLSERLGVEFPEDGYVSLGGFLAERSGRVPVPGTTVQWNGFTFTVLEGDTRKATKVEIVVNKPNGSTAEAHRN